MSAATLEAPVRAVPNTPRLIGTPGEPVTIDAIAVVADITFAFSTEHNRWEASSTNPAIVVPQDKLYQITWNLIPPSGIDPSTVFFQNPGVTFPEEQPIAPMLVIQSPQEDTKQVVALWANVDSTRRGLYHYLLNAMVAGQPIHHDPTVENDPPTI